jgi:hypothetical protein
MKPLKFIEKTPKVQTISSRDPVLLKGASPTYLSQYLHFN